MAAISLLILLLALAGCNPGGELGAAPAAPQPRVTVIDGGATVDWDPVSGAGRYRLYWFDGAASNQTSSLPAQDVEAPARIEGLQNGRTYYIALTSMSAGGESAYSEIVEFAPRPAPFPPGDVRAVTAAGAISLTWEAVATAESYKIYIARSDDVADDAVASAPSFIGAREATAPKFSEPSLINGVEYAVVVTAINSSGESAPSTIVKVTPGPYRNLTAGFEHTCVIDADGELWCWGGNSTGQIRGVPIGDTTRVAVRAGGGYRYKLGAAGAFHTCGVGGDESLTCWGTGESGALILAPPVRTIPVPSAQQWMSVSTNESVGCATRGDGTLWCGGIGAPFSGDVWPVTIVDLANDWLDVATGGYANLARKRDGSLWSFSQADGSASTVPIKLSAAAGWKKVAAYAVGQVGRGAGFCAIDGAGAMWCGRSAGEGSDRGILARGEAVDGDASFGPISSDATWTDVSVGGTHACGVQADGSLWCWGGNDFGQLGNDVRADQYTPRRTGANEQWSRVVAGDAHTCAQRRDGTIWCVGDNVRAQIGNDVTFFQSAPAKVLSDVRDIATANRFTCAVKNNDETWCWGEVEYVTSWNPAIPGPHGINQPVAPYGRHSAPFLLDATHQFSQLFSTSNGGMCGVAADGALWCWGGYVDALANRRPSPVRAADPESWAATRIFGNTRCQLREDQTIWCADTYSNNGELTLKSNWRQMQGGTATWTQLVSGDYHACAIDAANDLWCWGQNNDNQFGNSGSGQSARPVKIRSARNAAAALNYTCIVALDRTLWCWGRGYGFDRGGLLLEPQQIGPDADWDGVFAQSGRVCARKVDGSLWCGGRPHDVSDSYNFVFPASPEEPVRLDPIGDAAAWQHVASGSNHSCGLTSKNDVYCWGRNDAGQVGSSTNLPWYTEWQQVKFTR